MLVPTSFFTRFGVFTYSELWIRIILFALSSGSAGTLSKIASGSIALTFEIESTSGGLNSREQGGIFHDENRLTHHRGKSR